MDFHHMKDKIFCLNKSNTITYKWTEVVAEIAKCVLLCCRCHREYHSGLISEQEVQEEFLRRRFVVAVV
tara:strand:- start:234 stop:440 length:207 start_codon:yes stop_codon:yes gene_type:complete